MDNADIDQLLARFGISLTQQRRQIARILFARPQHVSAEQILEQVNREGVVASKATIYNTLGLFARKGLIREIVADPTRIFYDSNTSPHHHFFHVGAGYLEDIGEGQITVGQNITPPEGTEVESVDIVVRVRAKD